MDLAALVDAFTRLGEASGQARWIAHAQSVAEQLLDHFWDAQNGGLFTTADDGEQLIVRQKDLTDNATPSANSTTALALYRLAALTGETRYVHLADQILQLFAGIIHGAPTAFGNLLAAVHLRHAGTTEIVIGRSGGIVPATGHLSVASTPVRPLPIPQKNSPRH